MEASGSARVLAEGIVVGLGAEQAVLAVILSCALMTYGGVSLFVVAFAVFPIAAAAEAAIVLAFTPLCVARAEQQPDQIELLKKQSTWSRSEFVIKAGWVANVTEKYRSEVARVCGTTIVEAINTPPKPAG